MSRWTHGWLVAAAVALLVLGVSGTSAGQQAQAGAGKVMDQAAIQRSRAIQAELARIEANTEEFVDELLGRWAPSLPPEIDLWGQVKNVAMAATPWRLLGASLTTDFESGFSVLRGIVGPGWYVSAYVEGREPTVGSGIGQARPGVPGGAAEVLGDSASLVYTPIEPCRIVDTRGTGAKTGKLVAQEARAFDFTAAGLSKGQGGDTSCPGLPVVQARAWAVNITVTGYEASGHLSVYPYGTPQTSTSFLNYSTSAYAVANAGTVTGSAGLPQSVDIRAYSTTHVIVDVMGYYDVATRFATGAVTQLSGGALTTVLPNEYSTKFGPVCPAGTVVIGGSGSTDGWGKVLIAAFGFLNKGYWMSYFNTSSTTAYNAVANSHCMDVQ